MVNAEHIIEHIDGVLFEEVSYRKYLDDWLNGMKSEVYFWQQYMETKKSDSPDEWADLISNDRAFGLDEYLTSDKTKFLDVGSGPFSTCGLKTIKTELEFHAVDPLAYIYTALKEKKNILSGVTPHFAMVERLDEKFEQNEFDIVHMRNALDHAFNPILGIMQLLSICKIGGKIILCHAKNEAENENYSGFHQWNLCPIDDEFVIWRPGVKYNVSRMFSDYADVSVNNETPNESPGHFTVVLIKKKEAGFQNNPVQRKVTTLLNEHIFKKLSEMIVTDACRRHRLLIVQMKKSVRKIPFVGYWARKIYETYQLNKRKGRGIDERKTPCQ